MRCEQKPRSGAVSSVEVETGQRKDQQRAKGGREIPGKKNSREAFLLCSQPRGPRKTYD